MKTTLLMLSACAVTAFAAGPAMSCADLAKHSFGSDVKIDSAKLMPATANLPEHCEVQGVIWPEARYVVKLPTAWNERFEMVGNGGWAGTISTAAVDAAVRLGYASTSTDTGHDARKEPGAIWALKTAENPNARRKVIDHGYLSVHETALLAKKMIRAYYGADAKYSYWVGCSTGGRQGLMEAQRYPEDFDGYVVGAPVLFLTGLQMKAVWNWVQIGPGQPGEIKSEQYPALEAAVYDQCDAIDGVKDGLIENPLKCNFDPAKDLKKCAAAAPGCFTDAQISAMKVIYDGVRNSKGDLLFPGMPPGAEVFTAGPGGKRSSGWEQGLSPSFGLGDTFMKYMAFDDPPGANWDYRTFNVDRDSQRMYNTGLIINATITDLSAVKARGGKIVHYHGWADQGVTSRMSVDYFSAVNKTMGDTSDFYRFFPVPGMFHCQGGPGCGDVDWLSAAVNWVEKGQAPEMLIGGHVEQGKTTRTRPICKYPLEARYKGTGSIDEATNFSCQNVN